METPWKVILAFVGVFVAGAIFGGVFTLRASGKKQAEVALARPGAKPAANAATPPSSGGPPQAASRARPNPITPQLMRIFTRRLPDLTPEQKKRIVPIVERAGEDMQRLRQENFADTQRVTERMYADVSAVLTPEQRAEIETMRRQLHERLQAERQKKIEAAMPAEGSGAEKSKPANTGSEKPKSSPRSVN